MLNELSANDNRFKRLQFRSGLNLVVAQRAEQSTDTDSRNGSGKSSLIEVFHFVLGMSRTTGSVLGKAALKQLSMSLELDLSERGRCRATRSLERKSSVILARGDGSSSKLTVAEWVALLGDELFHLEQRGASGLSARELLNYYARRASQDSFTDPVRPIAMQSASRASANVAYLLGLDWRGAKEFERLAAKEGMRAKLKAAAKDPSFDFIFGSVSELRAQVAIAQRRVAELDSQISSFKVVPEYERLQAQADEIDAEIRSIRARDEVDRRNLIDLEFAIGAETPPDDVQLRRVYDELGVYLPDAVVRRYRDVARFHESVISNRRAYLRAEIEEVRSRLDESVERRRALGEEHAALLGALSSGGALDAFNVLQAGLSSARSRLDSLRERLATVEQLEATGEEIQLERVRLKAELNRDLRERAEHVAEINVLFQDFAGALYGTDREAFIEIEANEKSFKVEPHIGGEDSDGIGKMVVFCFDLTLAVVAKRGERGPDFLVHDSQLFDGVDERQVLRALELARVVADREGIQYIATLNSDTLALVEGLGGDFIGDVVQPQLSDAYDEGGLFGFRFE